MASSPYSQPAPGPGSPPYLPPPPAGPHNIPGDPAEPMPLSVNYTPDYQALIQQDPVFQQLQQYLSAQGIQDASQRQAATQQALIQFGEVPDFSSLASSLGLSPQAIQMLQQDIDPAAAALARQNTASGLSTEAQLQQGQSHAITALRNALAARGALGSGDNAYRTNLQDQAYAQQQQQALASVLAGINGYQSQYLNAQTSEQQQYQQGLQAALAFESSLPQNQGFHLQYDPKTGTYRDSSGSQYAVTMNADGTWTLTNSSSGAVYTLNANGQLTAGAPTPPPAPVPPPPPAPVPPPYDMTHPGHNPSPPPPLPPPPPPGGGPGLPSGQGGGTPPPQNPPPGPALNAPLGAPPAPLGDPSRGAWPFPGGNPLTHGTWPLGPTLGPPPVKPPIPAI